MNDFDAAVEWLVQSGRAKSKGDARRTLKAALDGSILGEALGESGDGVYIAPRLGLGFAGASPAIPNIAARNISFAGQNAGVATAGLMETFQSDPPKRSIGDWLERSDYGYGLGLAAFLAGSITVLAAPAWWPLAGALVLVAFVLCWWFS